MQLTDTHLVLLSAASQRNDKLLVRDPKLGQKGAEKLAARLLTAELVETVAVSTQDPHWSISPDGERIGLRLRKAGLNALGIDEDDRTAPAEVMAPVAPVVGGVVQRVPPGTKRALVLALLQCDGGASVEAIVQATGWLPHSTRAALTGLRKAGYHLVKGKNDSRQTIYRLIDHDAVTGSQVGAAVEGCR